MQQRRRWGARRRLRSVAGRALLATAVLAMPWAVGRAVADEGAVLYAKLCASCHGATGHGDGPAAGALTPPPTDLTTSKLGVPELMRIIDGRRYRARARQRRHAGVGPGVRAGIEDSGGEHRDALREIQFLAEYVHALERAAPRSERRSGASRRRCCVPAQRERPAFPRPRAPASSACPTMAGSAASANTISHSRAPRGTVPSTSASGATCTAATCSTSTSSTAPIAQRFATRCPQTEDAAPAARVAEVERLRDGERHEAHGDRARGLPPAPACPSTNASKVATAISVADDRHLAQERPREQLLGRIARSDGA